MRAWHLIRSPSQSKRGASTASLALIPKSSTLHITWTTEVMIRVAPGESRQVEFELSARDFSFYSTRHGRWLAESGDFELLIGASSRDVRLRQTVTLQSTEELNYRISEYNFFRELWSNPALKPLLIELMPKWLASQVADGQPLEEAVIQDFLQDQPMIKFPYFTGGEVSAEEVRGLIARCNEMTYTP